MVALEVYTNATAQCEQFRVAMEYRLYGLGVFEQGRFYNAVTVGLDHPTLMVGLKGAHIKVSLWLSAVVGFPCSKVSFLHTTYRMVPFA